MNEMIDSVRSDAAPGSSAVVSVSSLLGADSPRSSGEDEEHVKLLAGVQAELPPIIVHRGTMRVIDGMHRLRAAVLRKQDKIAVRFFDGDQNDAFVLAVKMNISHGLPLSLTDRKAAAGRIMQLRPEWSNRLIASTTGLAPQTVAEIRRQHGAEATSGDAARIGRDGRVRPVDNTKGRRLAGELMRQQPDLSLRQVARMAGISPETARNVRSRVNRGEQPVRPPVGRRLRDCRGARASGNQAGDAALAEPEFLDQLWRRLRADPSLRFSETGRLLLRLLQAHAMSEETWRRIADNTPPHHREMLARVARHWASAWRTFAERLETEMGRPESGAPASAGGRLPRLSSLQSKRRGADMAEEGLQSGTVGLPDEYKRCWRVHLRQGDGGRLVRIHGRDRLREDGNPESAQREIRHRDRRAGLKRDVKPDVLSNASAVKDSADARPRRHADDRMAAQVLQGDR